MFNYQSEFTSLVKSRYRIRAEQRGWFSILGPEDEIMYHASAASIAVAKLRELQKGEAP